MQPSTNRAAAFLGTPLGFRWWNGEASLLYTDLQCCISLWSPVLCVKLLNVVFAATGLECFTFRTLVVEAISSFTSTTYI